MFKIVFNRLLLNNLESNQDKPENNKIANKILLLDHKLIKNNAKIKNPKIAPIDFKQPPPLAV